MEIIRCAWPKSDPLQIEYHDKEWGVPLFDDQKIFEFIILETFQAGLSWQTILNKRENFRKAFDGFDAKKIAHYEQNKLEKLMLDSGIIRNRLKIQSSVSNAQAFLRLQKEHQSFANYIWQFTKGKTKINNWNEQTQCPSTSLESDMMSKSLKNEGFKFIGSTICYAFMQATGMVNDHLLNCYRHKEILSK